MSLVDKKETLSIRMWVQLPLLMWESYQRINCKYLYKFLLNLKGCSNSDKSSKLNSSKPFTKKKILDIKVQF